MATFRKSAIAIGVTMSAIFASNAFAVGSKADCEYEGGEAFNLPDGAQVCIIQIRGEEYHGEEYDGNQLGVKSCEGDLIGDGLFCKITLVEGKKKVELTPEEAGVGLKAGDVVNEKGEKVTDALPAVSAKNAKKALKAAKKAATAVKE